MKKILLVLLLLSNVVFAYPGMDFSPVGTQFMLMQQQNFQRNEADNLRRFTDTFDESDEYDPEELKRKEYQIKNLKAPTKIDLGSKKQELPAVPEDNKFIQKNGKIFIENSHHDDDETDSFRDLFD